jgi:hypothetical protein
LRIPSDNHLFEQVVEFVCDAEHQSYEMVMGKHRYPELVRARKIVSSVMSEQFRWSQTRTSRQWDLDPTSVFNHLHSMTAEESKVAEDLGNLFMEDLVAY